ncbi:hypothetical protein Vadar_000543 [Vaccinium darrowii]|uniref:Uncharacterized protein n=1 Tax=Vaccinium darrowii TaxID=229202 RepID=A0ACB7WWU0_9ERIC|nr:hypothetical protein Vadar_000543 [Vaccinium darrowii]
MAARLREIKAGNDSYDEDGECLSNMPTVGDVENGLESFQDKSSTVGDPIKGPRRGRPPGKRKQSMGEQIIRKNAQAKKRIECSSADAKSIPDVDVHTHATGFHESVMQESCYVAPSQGSVGCIGMWSYDLNESPFDLGLEFVMDSMKILICRYGSEVLVVRLVGGIKLFDVFRKICDRWDTLCFGRFSLSYVLEGCNCKLIDEEDFDNMLYLCPDSNRIYSTVEEVRPSIALSGGSTTAVTVGAIGVLEDVDMEEPLDKFCRHTETRVTAKCKFERCEWRVHAILDRSSREFVIKDLLNEHRCGSTYRRNKHKRVTSSLVASEIASMVNQNNNTSPMHILEFFVDKYGLDLPYYHA